MHDVKEPTLNYCIDEQRGAKGFECKCMGNGMIKTDQKFSYAVKASLESPTLYTGNTDTCDDSHSSAQSPQELQEFQNQNDRHL